MGYTTVGQALYWLEKPTGKTVKDDRCELIEILNEIRQHFYLLYEDTPLFLDGEECITVQQYPMDCNCKETFLGITLPPEYETPEAVWINNVPIKMYDKWREYRDGIKSGCGCKLAVYDMQSFYPTERDISPCGECKYIKFKAEHPADCGKTVQISFKDASGQDKTEEVLLANEYIRTETQVMHINDRGGIVLPPGLHGSVTVAEECGRILSVYGPTETVPSYRRMKVEGVCCGDQVYVKANRRFMPLYFDNDVIETDNRLAIQEAARYFQYNNSTRADMQYEAKAATHAANAKFYLLGEKSRHRGKATISQMRYTHGELKQSDLYGKRGSMRGRYGSGSRFRGGGRARR